MKIILILGKDIQQSDENSAVIEDKSDNEVPESHPFTYMLGNLMKKMDTKHTDTDTNQNQCKKSDHDKPTEEYRKMEVNTNKHSIEEETQKNRNMK